MNIKKLAVIASLSLLSLSVLAGGVDSNEKSKYFRVGYNLLTYDESPFSDADLSAVDVGIGMFFNKNFGVEARLGVGLGDDTISGIKLELNNYFGIYARGEIPLPNRFSVYGLLGVAAVDLKASAGGIQASAVDNDISYGVGVMYSINNKSSVGLEYLMLYDEGPTQIDGLSINYQMKF